MELLLALLALTIGGWLAFRWRIYLQLKRVSDAIERSTVRLRWHFGRASGMRLAVAT